MVGYIPGGDPEESGPPTVNNDSKQKFWNRKSAPIPLRPIRLIQLLLDVMLISVTVSLWMRSKNPKLIVAWILLISLFAIFAVVMSIDVVGQIGGYLTPDFPMFLVSLLGFVLFTAAAQVVFLIIYPTVINGPVIVLIAMCLFAALLFLLDAMIMTMYWRYTYAKRGKCLPCLPDRNLTILDEKLAHDTTSETLQTKLSKSRPIVRDVSTSVSLINQRLTESETLFSSDNYGMGVGERRQYVDCATNTDSMVMMILVGTQTDPIEPKKLVDHETSAVAPAAERDVQTYSQCPVCSNAMEYSPEGICPSFLAMVQSFGMSSCPGSNSPTSVRLEAPLLVDRGTSLGSNSSFEVINSCVMIPRKPPRVYETRRCPTHGAGLVAQRAGLPNPVTKICLPYTIRKNKRTQTPKNKPIGITDKDQNTEESIVENTTDANNSRKSSKETKTEAEEITEITNEEKIESEIEKSSGESAGPDGGSSQDTPFKSSFSLPRSTEKVNLLNPETRTVENSSGSNNDKSTSQMNFFRRKNKVDSITSTETSPIGPESLTLSSAINPDIRSPEISSYSNESIESVSPGPSCQCSHPHYYYKDVFGRHICGHCAHKYLIKIPQRRSIEPAEDVRCCSCSREMMHQTQKCWKCRYQMYAGNRK